MGGLGGSSGLPLQTPQNGYPQKERRILALES